MNPFNCRDRYIHPPCYFLAFDETTIPSQDSVRRLVLKRPRSQCVSCWFTFGDMEAAATV